MVDRSGWGASAARTPLIGRKRELAELDLALEQAVRYETPQSVLLVGSQGCGKTKLLNHWMHHAREAHPTLRVLTVRCRPGDASYGVFRRLLALRFPAPDSEDVEGSLRAQLEEVVQDRRLTELLHFLGVFLGISLGDSPFLRTLQDDPARHDQIARAVLRRFLELDAARSPLLIAVDDLQLADAASLALLRELCEQLGGVPLVIAAAGRTEVFTGGGELSEIEGEHRVLELEPLSEDESADLVRQLLAGVDEIPEELLEVAVETTSGSPLFIERLIRVLIDDGTIELDEQGRGRVHVDRVAEAELPMSVADAVDARISVLSPAERDVLEKASVLGGVFWLGSLVCLSRLQQEVESKATLWIADVLQATIGEVLDELVARDYLLRMPDSSIPGEQEYAFKHNMEREQIRRRLSPERERQFHLSAAQWIETRVSDRSEDQLEYLGQHYERGGNQQRAAYCFLHAGDRARARFANAQAIQYYQRGLALLELDNALAKIEGVHNLGEVCELLGRNQEAEQAYAEMLHLAWLLDHKDKGAVAHRRLGRLRRELGDYDRAVGHFKMGIKLFESVGDRAGVAHTLDELGKLAWMKGAYQRALEHHQEALRLKRELGDQRTIPVSLNNLGRVFQDSGAVKEAERHFEEALEGRKALGDRLGVIDSLSQLGGLHRAQSDYAKAFALWTSGLRLARELGDRQSEADLMVKISEALIQLGRLREAEQHLSEAAAIASDLGNRRLKAECQRILAEVYLSAGRREEAGEAARFALETFTDLSLDPQRGAALLVLAQIAAGEGGEERRVEAGELFDEAIELFDALGNQLELARALSSLADFHDRRGDPDAADDCRRQAEAILAGRSGANP